MLELKFASTESTMDDKTSSPCLRVGSSTLALVRQIIVEALYINAGTGKWTGMVEWTMEWTREFKIKTHFHSNTQLYCGAICLIS